MATTQWTLMLTTANGWSIASASRLQEPWCSKSRLFPRSPCPLRSFRPGIAQRPKRPPPIRRRHQHRRRRVRHPRARLQKQPRLRQMHQRPLDRTRSIVQSKRSSCSWSPTNSSNNRIPFHRVIQRQQMFFFPLFFLYRRF